MVDLQYFMIDRLRGEIDSLHGCADELLQMTRFNMFTQERTHLESSLSFLVMPVLPLSDGDIDQLLGTRDPAAG